MLGLPNTTFKYLRVHFDAIPSVATADERLETIRKTWDACMEMVNHDGRAESRAAQSDLDEFRDHVARELDQQKVERDRLLRELFPDESDIEELAVEEARRRADAVQRVASRFEREGHSTLTAKAFIALMANPATNGSLCRDADREKVLALRALRRREPSMNALRRPFLCRDAYSAAVRVRSLKAANKTLELRSSVWQHARWYAAACGVMLWTDLPLGMRHQMEIANRVETDPFQIKMDAIVGLIEFAHREPEKAHDLLSVSRGKKAVYLAAAERAGLGHEDPESSFRKDMDKNFSRMFRRSVPKNFEEWKVFAAEFGLIETGEVAGNPPVTENGTE